MDELTSIPLYKSTRKRLAKRKISLNMRNYDDLLNYLLSGENRT